ncbi:MAG: mechanosensitive ion channel, partial [Rhodospirillales bacterium]|nr:mechanosensitive ion channel [Rhodospirillales bacterium]
ADRLAHNVRGVAEVENRLQVAQDLEGRLAPAVKTLGEIWNGFVRLLPVLLFGVAIITASVLLGRWLARWRAFYRRIAANDFIASLLAQLVQGLVVVIGAALTLLLLDATGVVNTLLGAAGILGLALGFALRDTVENFIASILLSLRRPFNPKDYVRIEGHEGIVARLTSRATILLTLEGNQVRIPNATVFKGLIVNFTNDPQRRFTFKLGISPAEDLGRAQRAAISALATVDGVLSNPPAAALYEEVADSSVTLTLSGWMDQTRHDFLRVRSEAIRIVLAKMAEVGVDLPEPTLRLRRAPQSASSDIWRGDRVQTEPDVPSAGDEEGIPTTLDPSLNPVIDRERSGRPDLLQRSGAVE